mmetsp:Transcript_7362/g.25094  ORF Transcript_7362/g.25094 Transcript_7362/m.25094 type:complete len:133 (+) Transcript_7362:490-888(+)
MSKGILLWTACTPRRTVCYPNLTSLRALLNESRRSDMPRNYTVHVFCPMCRDIFTPRSSRSASIDGAYFGTTFPHLFMMTFPELIPHHVSQPFVPRVFGFRIHKSSPYHAAIVTSSGAIKRRSKVSRRAKAL